MKYSKFFWLLLFLGFVDVSRLFTSTIGVVLGGCLGPGGFDMSCITFPLPYLIHLIVIGFLIKHENRQQFKPVTKIFIVIGLLLTLDVFILVYLYGLILGLIVG